MASSPSFTLCHQQPLEASCCSSRPHFLSAFTAAAPKLHPEGTWGQLEPDFNTSSWPARLETDCLQTRSSLLELFNAITFSRAHLGEQRCISARAGGRRISALVDPRGLQVVFPARHAGICIMSFTSHSWGMDFFPSQSLFPPS